MNEAVLDAPASRSFVAFLGDRAIGAGTLREVAMVAKPIADADCGAPIIMVDAVTSEPIDLDLRGTIDQVLGRLPGERPATLGADEPSKPGRGRPRLGVVAREVTLLPRHWEWLAEQSGGASVTLRRLVEQARSAGGGAARLRRSQESAYRFMSAMLGNHAGFEEATRALFAGDAARFREYAQSWPIDLRAHAERLADTVFHERDTLETQRHA